MVHCVTAEGFEQNCKAYFFLPQRHHLVACFVLRLCCTSPPKLVCRFATPMRTPRAAAARGEDRLVAEAQNLARLQQGQTPLFGGDSGVHIEKGDFGDSLDPRAGQSVRATPSALAGMTPAGGQTGMRSIAGVPGTPSVAGTPLRTTGTQSCHEATFLPWDKS